MDSNDKFSKIYYILRAKVVIFALTSTITMSESKFRIESDLLGELKVPADAYYGVQTQRALENYRISTTRMCHYPEYIIAMAYV